MMLLLLAMLVSAAEPCVPHAAIKVLQGASGDLKEAYLCLAVDDAGDDLLAAALDLTGASPAKAPVAVASPGNHAVVPAPVLDDDAVHARLTRALALWLLQHNTTTWDPALVRRLPAVDRRLLGDGVRARAGRASPAPDHAKVFANFDWYRPVATYTDSRLNDVDRANIAMADKPPPAPPPTAPPVADAPAPPPPIEASPTTWCGCVSQPAPAAGWLVVAAAALTTRRRRGASGATPGR